MSTKILKDVWNYSSTSTKAEGSCKSVRLPIHRTEQYKKSAFYIGCKDWNELDEAVREIIVSKEFKKKI